MSGPWEKYAADTKTGPWTGYASDGSDPTGSFGQNVLAGAGKAFYDVGRGVGQLARKVLPERAADAVGLPTQADIDEAKRLDEPLMKTGGGILGNIAGMVGLTVPTLAIPGVNSYTGAAVTGGILGALQPTASDESRALNTAGGAALGAGGKWAGGKIADTVMGRFTDQSAKAASAAAQNAPRDATLAAGKQAGYVVPPTQANPQSAWNQLLEGLSGKIKTSQAASVKNQQVTNSLVREAIGLPPDTPITPQALEAVRRNAGQAYQAVDQLGAVAPDNQFLTSVQSLARNKLSGATSNPADDAIGTLVKELQGFGQWTGSSLKNDIKNLREMAKANYGAADRAGGDVGKSALAKAQSSAAELLEDLAERNLGLNNAPPDVIKNFREARQLIAKTYSVENALNESTGNIIAQRLASQLEAGKPLSGKLEQVAKFSQSFPKATQNVDKTAAGLQTSPLDWAATTGMAAADMGLTSIAGLVARPAVRSLLLSSPYQATMANPSYTVGALTRMGKSLANPELQRLMPALAAGAGMAYME